MINVINNTLESTSQIFFRVSSIGFPVYITIQSQILDKKEQRNQINITKGETAQDYLTSFEIWRAISSAIPVPAFKEDNKLYQHNKYLTRKAYLVYVFKSHLSSTQEQKCMVS